MHIEEGCGDSLIEMTMSMKRRFDLTPHIGASDIKLGMSRNEIVGILGEPESSTEKSVLEFQGFKLPMPAKIGYFQNELQITFDDNGAADFIEFYGRGVEHTTVLLNGVDVFKTPAPDLLQAISAMTRTGFNEDDEEIPYCYVFADIDLGVWRQVIPELDEWENRIPESDEGKYFWSLGIGRKGYYKKAT